MTELLVGTKKGLFVLEGARACGFEGDRARVRGRARQYAMRDPASGRILAAVTSAFTGRSCTTPRTNGEWTQATGVALPEGGGQALERLWVIVSERTAVCTWAATPACCSSRPTAAGWSLVRSYGSTRRGGLAARRRRAVPALDRPVAGRAGEARARDVRRRRLADRRRHGDVAAHGNEGLVPRCTCPTTPSRA